MSDKTYKITKQGSLGLLALGHIGLKQWRKVVEEEKIKEQQTTAKKNDQSKK
jgi:hypothetical protein